MTDDEEFNVRISASILPPGEVRVQTLALGMEPQALITFGAGDDGDDEITFDVLAAGGPEDVSQLTEALRLLVEALDKGAAQ